MTLSPEKITGVCISRYVVADGSDLTYTHHSFGIAVVSGSSLELVIG